MDQSLDSIFIQISILRHVQPVARGTDAIKKASTLHHVGAFFGIMQRHLMRHGTAVSHAQCRTGRADKVGIDACVVLHDAHGDVVWNESVEGFLDTLAIAMRQPKQ